MLGAEARKVEKVARKNLCTVGLAERCAVVFAAHWRHSISVAVDHSENRGGQMSVGVVVKRHRTGQDKL